MLNKVIIWIDDSDPADIGFSFRVCATDREDGGAIDIPYTGMEHYADVGSLNPDAERHVIQALSEIVADYGGKFGEGDWSKSLCGMGWEWRS